ncbi:hypothetical protein ACFLZ8_05385 [Planctomycetota bacterium]
MLSKIGSSRIAGYENIPSGTDLSGINQQTIRLQANLSREDSGETPVLYDWFVSYTDSGSD